VNAIQLRLSAPAWVGHLDLVDLKMLSEGFPDVETELLEQGEGLVVTLENCMHHPFLRPGFGDELLCFFSIVCPFLIYPYIVRIFGHPGKQVVNLVNDWLHGWRRN